MRKENLVYESKLNWMLKVEASFLYGLYNIERITVDYDLKFDVTIINNNKYFGIIKLNNTDEAKTMRLQ